MTNPDPFRLITIPFPLWRGGQAEFAYLHLPRRGLTPYDAQRIGRLLAALVTEDAEPPVPVRRPMTILIPPIGGTR